MITSMIPRAPRRNTIRRPVRKSKPRTILVVEDDPSITKLIRWRLECGGFDVVNATSSDEVMLTAARGQLELIVLVERGLNFGSTLEIPVRIREAGLTVPFILISGNFDESLFLEGLQAFANGLAPKVHGDFSALTGSASDRFTDDDVLAATSVRERNKVQREMILVVDDDDSFRQMARIVLEQANYQVLGASNGKEAVDIFTRKCDEIRLVLTDMRMPLMDGPAVIRAVRRMNPTVRILATSGLPSTDAWAFDAGIEPDFFLHKPYPPRALLSKVQEILDLDRS